MNSALLLTGSKLVGYKDVEWENRITTNGYYQYAKSEFNVTHNMLSYTAPFYNLSGINGYELYELGGSNSWKDLVSIHESNFNTYLAQDNARIFIPTADTWTPSGNQGFKTLLEYTALETDVINGTKRNLTGVKVFK